MNNETIVSILAREKSGTRMYITRESGIQEIDRWRNLPKQ